jgi:hypothetical protein
MRILVAQNAARGDGVLLHLGESRMHDLGPRAPNTDVKRGFSIPERLLLIAGSVSALILMFTAFRGS